MVDRLAFVELGGAGRARASSQATGSSAGFLSSTHSLVGPTVAVHRRGDDHVVAPTANIYSLDQLVEVVAMAPGVELGASLCPGSNPRTRSKVAVATTFRCPKTIRPGNPPRAASS